VRVYNTKRKNGCHERRLFTMQVQKALCKFGKIVHRLFAYFLSSISVINYRNRSLADNSFVYCADCGGKAIIISTRVKFKGSTLPVLLRRGECLKTTEKCHCPEGVADCRLQTLIYRGLFTQGRHYFMTSCRE